MVVVVGGRVVEVVVVDVDVLVVLVVTVGAVVEVVVDASVVAEKTLSPPHPAAVAARATTTARQPTRRNRARVEALWRFRGVIDLAFHRRVSAAHASWVFCRPCPERLAVLGRALGQ